MDSRISARALSALLGHWRTGEPAYEALADGIRLLCLDNRVAPRTALPAERELAGVLGVSRTTVAAAYRSLRDSRNIESLRGSGSVTLPLVHATPGRWFGGDGIDLQQASPPAWPGLPGIIAEVATGATALIARAGYDIVGDPQLRAEVAARYCRAGIATRPEQIMVTTGAQSALHLVASVLVRRGDRVLIETPTYPHAAEAFRRAGGRLVAVPVTSEEGWDLDRAVQAFARTLPVAAYVMPDFQNPTGRTMTARERRTFEDAAERAGTILIVDETTADLDIDRPWRPAPFAVTGSVIRVGSLGKVVWGGLRIGWIRADDEVIGHLVAARSAQDLGTPELEQAIAARLVGCLDDIIPQRAHLLREGRDALVAALVAALPSWRVPAVDGGVSLWVDLGAPLSSALVMDARSHGVYLSAGPRFAVDGGHERRLRIPFTLGPGELVRAVETLAASWARVQTGSAQTPATMFDAVV